MIRCSPWSETYTEDMRKAIAIECPKRIYLFFQQLILKGQEQMGKCQYSAEQSFNFIIQLLWHFQKLHFPDHSLQRPTRVPVETWHMSLFPHVKTKPVAAKSADDWALLQLMKFTCTFNVFYHVVHIYMVWCVLLVWLLFHQSFLTSRRSIFWSLICLFGGAFHHLKSLE